MTSALFIGLMSGTSLDGLDAVLVEFAPADRPDFMRVEAHVHQGFAPELVQELLSLNASGPDELHRAALASNALARVGATAIRTLLAQTGRLASDICCVGAHGQTVRHRPGEFDSTGYTIQLNNPALLAELTDIDVVADLRSRDVAAGGQGAPLVPAFHRAAFWRNGEELAVMNIGGISNLTAVRADGDTLGFDCGPGNMLMDDWCRRHTGEPFDRDGRWGDSGQVIEPLLEVLMSEPYFRLPPPKSTGRDLFNRPWFESRLASMAGERQHPEDVQATLCEFTARSCSLAALDHAPHACELLICGGGALNLALMDRLSQNMGKVQLRSTSSRGLPHDQVEACAFAWLARAFKKRLPGNVSTVTGAQGARVLGALYPAGTNL